MNCRRVVRPRGRWAVVLVLGLSVLAGSARGEVPGESQERLLEDLKYLASDELEGRGVGTKGLDRAADYIRNEFARAGLDVTRVNGGAFQPFEMTTGSELGERNALAFVGPDGKTVDLKYDRDFRTCAFGTSGTFDARLAFVGYGIDAPDEKYNDFDGIDLHGKVAILVRRVPRQDDKDSPFAGPHGGISRHAELRTKVSNAYSRGAVAVLLVNDPYTGRNEVAQLREQFAKAQAEFLKAEQALDQANPQDQETVAKARKAVADAKAHVRVVEEMLKNPETDPLVEFGYADTKKDGSIPVFHVTQQAVNRLLQAAAGKTLEQIEAAIDKDLTPQSFVLEGWSARGESSIRRIKTPVRNVIGVLEGSGPLADQTVIIGAHYDHVGWGGPGSGSLAVDPKNPDLKMVHNGADDNASGTVSLIELANRLARTGPLPRRVVFIAFTGEETGLIGSAYYTKHPVFPLDKTIAMFNMDMVGRLEDDKLTVFGTGTSPAWKPLLESAAKAEGLDLIEKPEGFGPSDHSSFYAEKIPVLHFFTGVHGDYHRPSDDWQKINYEGMARVVALIEDVVRKTIAAPQPPAYAEVKGKAQINRGGSRPYFGSIPDFGTEGEGYALSGVAPDSPADKGGLKKGDRIIKMGQYKIGSLEDFDLALRKFQPGEQVEVLVLRDGQQVPLKVTLSRPR